MNALDDAAAQSVQAGLRLAKADEDVAVAEMALNRNPLFCFP
jgi:hypothetical protein